MNIYYLFIIGFLYNFTTAFVPNANLIIQREQKIYSEILNTQNLHCHTQTSRVKTFKSANQKAGRLLHKNVYDLHDLIGFRFVFYNEKELLKFYHYISLEKTVMYTKNYINKPKDNSYSALHIRYKNEYIECPLKQLECQLYIIDDYYNAIYGEAKYHKNYTYYF